MHIAIEVNFVPLIVALHCYRKFVNVKKKKKEKCGNGLKMSYFGSENQSHDILKN